MWLVFCAVWLVYAQAVLRRLHGWRLFSEHLHLTTGKPAARVSVVVAIRNEAEGLPVFLAGLARQTYPQHLWELILVDDYSSDNSMQIADACATEMGIANFTLVNQAKTGAAPGKKGSLQAGIEIAQGEFIITTDADCLVPPEWLASMVEFAQATNAELVSGPVAYFPGNSLFGQLQAVEFSSLIGVGAASIALREPNMCNGANLLFRKKAFYEVGGYADNQTIASGDDEFLLHKIASRYPEGYQFLKSDKAVVKTKPSPNWHALFNQRVRWAGKSRNYTLAGPKWLAARVAAMQLAVLAAVGLAIAGVLAWQVPVLLICAKFAVELLFFGPVLRFFGLQRLLWQVAVLQVVYPPFVLAVALGTLTGHYSWKGRRIPNP